MKWRLINSGYLDGYTNMAIDEAMFTLCSANCIPPTLRLYGWEPPAISIGYFQSPLNPPLVRGVGGIDIVRRLTGGGAIFHDKELTFCLVTVFKDSIIPEDVSASYNTICGAVINGLQTLGIDARIRGNGNAAAASVVAKADLPQQKSSSVPQPFFCFARPSKYDIVFKDKKLVGSAQRRKNGFLLHHGSILLGDQYLENTGYHNGSTSINSILDRKVEFEELSKNVIQGFKKELSIDLIPGELTEEELELSRKLIVNKKKFTESPCL